MVILIVIIILGVLLWLIGNVLYYVALTEEVSEEFKEI